jgi:hypothetical protein
MDLMVYCDGEATLPPVPRAFLYRLQHCQSRHEVSVLGFTSRTLQPDHGWDNGGFRWTDHVRGVAAAIGGSGRDFEVLAKAPVTILEYGAAASHQGPAHPGAAGATAKTRK